MSDRQSVDTTFGAVPSGPAPCGSVIMPPRACPRHVAQLQPCLCVYVPCVERSTWSTATVWVHVFFTLNS